MAIVPVKLDDEEVKNLDLMVRLGFYKNRSQAIRNFIGTGIKEKMREFTIEPSGGVREVVEALLQLRRKGIEVMKVVSRKTAAELVAEGRERL